jgi:hypothetical protein
MAIPHRLKPARYYAVVFAVILGGALAQGWFAWWADPFGVRGSLRPKITALLGEQRRLFKAHDVLRQPPTLALCGTSRTEQALEPGHPAIAALGLAAYNLAMPGSSIYEQFRMIQHAHARQPLRAVWLELAFLVTAADQPRANPGFSEERLLVDAAGRPQPLHDLADLPLLLSLDGQGAAWRTIRSGSSPRRTLAETFDRGHFLPKNLDFAGNSRTSFVLGARKLHAEHYRRFVASDAGGGNRHLADLAALLAFCRANRIAATLFFAPEHAYYGWLLTRSGLWPAVSAFKQRVLALAGDDVPVWDFAAVGAVTAEPIPPADQPGRTMANYNDAGHFTPAVGRRLIATLASGCAVDGFGVRLHAATLAAELERQAALLDTWAAAHPADAAEVEALTR